MQNKSEMINRIAELAEENAELKKYIERMDKPEIQVIDAEILTLKEENAKLKAIIDSYQPKIQALKDENYGLNQELLGYKKGVQAAEIIELKAENERLKEENYQLQKDCQICENFIDFIPCKPIRDMDYDLQKVISQRDNYYQTLQKIKEIAERAMAKQQEYKKDFDEILDLITKAEEE